MLPYDIWTFNMLRNILVLYFQGLQGDNPCVYSEWPFMIGRKLLTVIGTSYSSDLYVTVELMH